MFSKITASKFFIFVTLICYTQMSMSQDVGVWLTTANKTNLLTQQSNETFNSTTSAGNRIVIDTTTTYQSIDGFGATMTGSSAYLIQTELDAGVRQTLLNDLFTDSGINLNITRHSMGASDYNLSSYTYNDIPLGQADPTLANFSLGQDYTYLIPTLQQVKSLQPNLKIMGTPWSAPAWMKEVYNLNGGWLDVANYQTYADYFVKYVQAYQAEGLDIWAVTIQNEPLYETSSYPSMRMDAGNQIAFLKNDIGPAFNTAGLNTGIIVYDHNWDRPDYPIDILNDPVARTYTIGSAFHGYSTPINPEAMSQVNAAHPDKGLWFTEITGLDNGGNFGVDLAWSMRNIIIGTTRNWAKGVLKWNYVLDQNSGPTNGGCLDCRGIVTVDTNTGTYSRGVEYYSLGHISKFVKPGAVRIASTDLNGIPNVAFQNPDGSIALVVLNDLKKPSQTITVEFNGQEFTYSIPKESAATFVWNPTTGSTNNPPVVNITSPISGTSFNSPANIAISASASDSDGQVVQVSFYNGNSFLGTDTTSPYTFDWNGIADGNYSLTAIATDDEGASTTSSSVNISVTTGNQQGGDMFVSEIVTGTQGGGRKRGTASVTIVDDQGGLISSATVTGSFSGSYNETVSGTTGPSGLVSFTSTQGVRGTVNFTFCVDNVVSANLTYNSTLNAETCDNLGSSSRSSQELDKLATQREFSIYPNPITDRKFVLSGVEDTEVLLTLINVSGQKVWSEKANIKGLIQLPQSLESGFYFLHFSDSGKNHVERIIIR